MEALRRIKANTVEKRLLNGKGNPAFGISFYVLNKKGEFAGVSMYQTQFAVCTDNGPETPQLRAAARGQSHRLSRAFRARHNERRPDGSGRLSRSPVPRYFFGMVQK